MTLNGGLALGFFTLLPHVSVQQFHFLLADRKSTASYSSRFLFLTPLKKFKAEFVIKALKAF